MSDELETPTEKPKMSEAKTEALRKAREKANLVRKQNAEEKRKTKEIEKAAVEKTKRETSERIQREYDDLQREKQPSEEEEEIVARFSCWLRNCAAQRRAAPKARGARSGAKRRWHGAALN